ncbi:flavodoxin [Candidatus Microgenomates bacterium]|jgi:flavodoxin|nr:MAG: flavodoxin [Candidatus Microgenomates bacterium]
MKVLIVCRSVHKGNTQKVTGAMASELKAKVLKPEEVKPADLEKYDLVGFGSGIYFGRHHETIFNLVKKLPFQNKKPAFVFSTAGMPKLKFVWHDPFKEVLKEKGFELVGEFCCSGHDEVGALKEIGGINKNRPNSNDLKLACLFAKKISLTPSDRIAL